MEEEDSDGEPSDYKCIDFDWRNPDSAPRLSRAIRAGDIDSVKKLIDEGASVNAADNRGWTPLHEAVKDDKYYDIAEELIRGGAYLEHKTVVGETPLFFAARYGSISILDLLIREGAVINCNNVKKCTPLHMAACCKRSTCEAVLLKLIASGAKVDALDLENRSALHFAVEENNITSTRVLLEAGLDPMVVDFYGRNVVVSACMAGNIEVLESVLGKLGHRLDVINYQSRDGWTLLMEAVQFKHLDIVKLLIRYGADTSLQEGRGLLALHLAAHSGRADILKLVLDNTPTEAIEATSILSSPRNVLHTRSLLALAIDKNNYESVELLLSRKDLSREVITCPVKMGNVLVSPASFLLMYADAVPHGEEKLKMLELLLSRPELVEPKYKKAVDVIDPIEAAISIHAQQGNNHPQHGCICYEYLKLILEKGGSADGQHLFQTALKAGFTSGISLLLSHSNTHEPEYLLKTMWADIHKNDRSWNGTEPNTFSYLMDLSTDHSITFESVRQESVDKSLDLVRRLVKTKRKPATLKRLARSSFRSYLHSETASRPSDFLPTVRLLDAPKSVVGFLMYNDI